MPALLHVAAFWVDGDQCEGMADMLADLKIPGTRGAVVTFRPDVADAFDFRRTMQRLDLSEVNEHPALDRPEAQGIASTPVEQR